MTLSQVLYLIRNMYDVRNPSQLHSLISQGVVGVLLEIVFKENIINDD